MYRLPVCFPNQICLEAHGTSPAVYSYQSTINSLTVSDCRLSTSQMCFPFSCRNSIAIMAPITLIRNDSDEHPGTKCYGMFFTPTITVFSVSQTGIPVLSSKGTTLRVLIRLRSSPVKYDGRYRGSHMPCCQSGGLILPPQTPTASEQKNASVYIIA